MEQAATIQKKKNKNSMGREAWRRFRKRPPAVVGLCYFAIIIFLVIFSNVFWNYQTQAIEQSAATRLIWPNAEHWFGTDAFGRDLLVRIAFGARNTLLLGAGATVCAAIIGMVLGSTAAFFGGKYDTLIMRVCDVMMSVPGILLCLAVIAGLGTGIPQLIVAMTIGGFAGFTRVFRSAVLGIVNQEYIEASRAMGGRNFYIITRHVIPNTIGTLLIQLTMNMASNMMVGAALSFLGMGAKIPTPEWGQMLKDGMNNIRTHSYLVTIPGVVLALTALSIMLIGDGLRDALDPKLKGRV
ncbi:MAG: ABC transporter permease [Ruminococcaceae bacterium]|nr:ABC transporter permease [Oscillospiraceae bacterium]